MRFFKESEDFGEFDEIKDRAAYHEFGNIEDAEAWGTETFGEWAKHHKRIYETTKRFSSNSALHVTDPVDMYLGYGFRQINQNLRYDEIRNIPNHIFVTISNLVISICSAPIIDRKIILYRQVSEIMINELVSKNRENKPYCEKGFMSTSLVETICARTCGNSQYMLKIYVNNTNPIHAIYADLIRRRDEAELLLQPELFMRMAKAPYLDKETDKQIYEVHLFSLQSEV